jgi:microcystin-dependent protein
MARWDLQASAGAAGRSLLWRGVWGSAISYNPYDAVYSGGSSYISKTNNQNKTPVSNPSDWDLLASVGGAGPVGPLGGLPVGSIIDYAGDTEPDGWLFCIGQIIPRTGIYADLYNCIKEAYGAGDGVTSFQLPDFRGRVSAAPDNMGGTFAGRLTLARSCNTTNGSTTLTNNDGNWGMVGGTLAAEADSFIHGPGIPAGTRVSAFLSGTQLTMSASATATTSGVTVRFSTLSDLGLNGSGGAQTCHLTVNQMPTHSHSQYYTTIGQTGGIWFTTGPYNWYGVTQATGGAGNDIAHTNTQPTLLSNKIIKYAAGAMVAPPTPGTGDVSGPTISTDGELVVFNGTSGKFVRRGGMLPSGYRLPRGHLAALKTANNPVDQVNDIDVQDGECRDSTNTVDIVLPSGMTKRLDAFWSAGTGQGGLDQIGALANQTYHVFVIKNVNTAEVDVLFSPSATAPLLPTGFTHKRRIASIIRKAGVIERYFQEGNYFYRGQPEKGTENGQLTVGNSTIVAWGNICIPLGITGMVIGYILAGANTSWVSPLVVPTSAIPVNSGSNPYAPYSQVPPDYGHMGFQALFDTSGSVKVSMIGNPGSVGSYWVTVLGWIDPRGKDN